MGDHCRERGNKYLEFLLAWYSKILTLQEQSIIQTTSINAKRITGEILSVLQTKDPALGAGFKI